MSTPRKTKLGKDIYHALVLEVRATDSMGRPTDVRVRYDEEVVDFDDPDQSRVFWVVYAPETMIRPRVGGRA